MQLSIVMCCIGPLRLLSLRPLPSIRWRYASKHANSFCVATLFTVQTLHLYCYPSSQCKRLNGRLHGDPSGAVRTRARICAYGERRHSVSSITTDTRVSARSVNAPLVKNVAAVWMYSSKLTYDGIERRSAGRRRRVRTQLAINETKVALHQT